MEENKNIETLSGLQSEIAAIKTVAQEALHASLQELSDKVGAMSINQLLQVAELANTVFKDSIVTTSTIENMKASMEPPTPAGTPRLGHSDIADILSRPSAGKKEEIINTTTTGGQDDPSNSSSSNTV